MVATTADVGNVAGLTGACSIGFGMVATTGFVGLIGAWGPGVVMVLTGACSIGFGMVVMAGLIGLIGAGVVMLGASVVVIFGGAAIAGLV